MNKICSGPHQAGITPRARDRISANTKLRSDPGWKWRDFNITVSSSYSLKEDIDVFAQVPKPGLDNGSNIQTIEEAGK